MENTQYRNVTVNGDHITGERTMGSAGWVKFSGCTDLMKIGVAVEQAPRSVRNKIWGMQDGFGAPGMEAGDWSGIRDSQPGTILDMVAVAEKWYGNKPWPWDGKAPQPVYRVYNEIYIVNSAYAPAVELAIAKLAAEHPEWGLDMAIGAGNWERCED